MSFEHLVKGTEEYEKGDVEKAIVELELAVEANPEDSTAWFVLGCSYAVSKNYIEAIAAYEKSITLEPEAHAYAALGKSLIEAEQFNAATECNRKAHQMRPDIF